MKPHLLGILLAFAVITAPPAKALEGSLTSKSREWQSAPAAKPVEAAEQAREQQARQAAMQAEKRRLEARLKTAPSAAAQEQLHAKLREVVKAYGWVPELKMVWGIRDIQGILDNESTAPEGLLQALVQLNKDFKARGIDFIYVPFPPTPHFQAHLVVKGIAPDQDYTPGWTRMLIQLIDNDIEILDPMDLYRKEANNPVVVNWPNDFHTASLGRQIAAQMLAERLQRYDFARELRGNRGLWTEQIKTATNAGWPQRITTVNDMFTAIKKDELQPGTPSWPVRHPARVSVLKPDAPNLEAELTNRPFQYMELKRSSEMTVAKFGRQDLVFIGDSQLHSPVHGAGLPEFYNREIGGIFRWGSKSWAGFDPPIIYREVVPDEAPAPRVVVLSSLVKYFWEGPKKYGPRPLPPPAGGDGPAPGEGGSAAPPAVGSATAAPAVLEATIRITGISAQLDPATLDYDEALAHNSAIIVGGPHNGKIIGVRYWTMKGRTLVKGAGAVRPGQVVPARLEPWAATLQREPGLGQHMIYDDVKQDLSVPVFWVVGGALAPENLLKGH